MFFSPVGTLTNVEDNTKEGTEANRGAFFTHITDWQNLDDTYMGF